MEQYSLHTKAAMKALLKQRTSQPTCHNAFTCGPFDFFHLSTLKPQKVQYVKTRVRTHVFKPVRPSLVGDGVIRVVCHIWARLVGGGCGGGALPSADVHRRQVLGHLSHLSSTMPWYLFKFSNFILPLCGQVCTPNNNKITNISEHIENSYILSMAHYHY